MDRNVWGDVPTRSSFGAVYSSRSNGDGFKLCFNDVSLYQLFGKYNRFAAVAIKQNTNDSALNAIWFRYGTS